MSVSRTASTSPRAASGSGDRAMKSAAPYSPPRATCTSGSTAVTPGRTVADDQWREDGAQHRELDVFDPAFPDLLLEHGHTVEDHHPAELRFETGVQKGRQTGADGGPRVRHGERGGHHPRDDVSLHRVVDGAKQRLLAAEVVVERPSRHARPLDDVLDRGRRVAPFGEQLAGDRDQEVVCLLRLAGPQRLDSHRPSIPTDHRSVTDH